MCPWIQRKVNEDEEEDKYTLVDTVVSLFLISWGRKKPANGDPIVLERLQSHGITINIKNLFLANPNLNLLVILFPPMEYTPPRRKLMHFLPTPFPQPYVTYVDLQEC